MLERIRLESLHQKVTTAENAVKIIKDGMTIGSSGFTKAGDSKAILPALAERGKTENLKVTLMTGASLGHGTDGKLAEADVIRKRMPFQVDPVLRNKINTGEILFIDQHLSESAELLHTKNLQSIDVAVIEAAYIERDGSIVPTTSVGNSVTFAALAKRSSLKSIRKFLRKFTESMIYTRRKITLTGTLSLLWHRGIKSAEKVSLWILIKSKLLFSPVLKTARQILQNRMKRPQLLPDIFLISLKMKFV